MKPNEVTVLIVAQNESRHIVEAIRNASSVGEILVVDGGSSDDTIALAREAGATVLENPFRYTAEQYNWGLEQVTTPWCLILDADERLGRTLVRAVQELDPRDPIDAYRIARRNYFLGKWISTSGWFPDYNIRLLRPDRARYEDRRVHARVEVDGAIGTLDGALHHLTYESIAQYIGKLNSYTTFEVTARRGAQLRLDSRSRARSVFLRLPLRPVIRFMYMYVVKTGFKDGQRGFDLAVLSALYEWIVDLKRRYDGIPIEYRNDDFA